MPPLLRIASPAGATTQPRPRTPYADIGRSVIQSVSCPTHSGPIGEVHAPSQAQPSGRARSRKCTRCSRIRGGVHDSRAHMPRTSRHTAGTSGCVVPRTACSNRYRCPCDVPTLPPGPPSRGRLSHRPTRTYLAGRNSRISTMTSDGTACGVLGCGPLVAVSVSTPASNGEQGCQARLADRDLARTFSSTIRR
jgi:hypothetical protein